MPSAVCLRGMREMKDSFAVNDALQDDITRFARQLCRGIRSPRARAAAEEEMIDHIYAALYEESLRGIPPETAFPVICASFGEPSVLRQQLAGVHNRLPPDFFRTLGGFVLRLAVAVLVTLFLRGLCLQGGVAWYTELPGVLILFGLRPLGAVGRAWRRLRFRGRVRRLCRRSGWDMLHFPSVGQVFLARRSALYVFRMGEDAPLTVIRHLSVARGESLRFADETTILRIRRRGGVGLTDRRPGQFNLSKTAALGHVTLRQASFSYLLPPELLSLRGDGTAFRVEKWLIIDRFPPEVSVVEGNAVREVSPGECVFDFSVHSQKSCLSNLVARTSKGD